MATSFPTALDDFTNPTQTSKLGDAGVQHHLQHANANDAIEALQAKVGIDGSADTMSLDYRVTGHSFQISGLETSTTTLTDRADQAEVLYWMSV